MLVLDAKSAERPSLDRFRVNGRQGGCLSLSTWTLSAGASRGQVGIAPTSNQLCQTRVPRPVRETSGAAAVGIVSVVTDENTESTDAAFSGEIPGLDDLQAQFEQMSPEEQQQIADAQQAMEESRARLASVPAEVVVTNHVMGLYELAAIHLSAEEPDLAQAALAIDALACLVDGLGDRLGPEAPTMVDALQNIRLAFVQIKGQAAPEG